MSHWGAYAPCKRRECVQNFVGGLVAHCFSLHSEEVGKFEGGGSRSQHDDIVGSFPPGKPWAASSRP